MESGAQEVALQASGSGPMWSTAIRQVVAQTGWWCYVVLLLTQTNNFGIRDAIARLTSGGLVLPSDNSRLVDFDPLPPGPLNKLRARPRRVVVSLKSNRRGPRWRDCIQLKLGVCYWQEKIRITEIGGTES